MKKIMFNDRYGLTQAVLNGTKTQTRRIIKCPNEFKGEWVAGFNIYKRKSDNAITQYPCMYDADEHPFEGGEILPKYRVGEIVAVAQPYKELFNEDCERSKKGDNIINVPIKNVCDSAGWNNKMFVKPTLMPHQIRITRVWIERLQDISDEDCMKEGIYYEEYDRNTCPHGFFCDGIMGDGFHTPREAYAALIDKVSGKGTWNSNPWVFCYEFV